MPFKGDDHIFTAEETKAKAVSEVAIWPYGGGKVTRTLDLHRKHLMLCKYQISVFCSFYN